MDGRREGGPEEDGCHKLEDTCTQKRRPEDGREGGQGPTRNVELWSSNSSYQMLYTLWDPNGANNSTRVSLSVI